MAFFSLLVCFTVLSILWSICSASEDDALASKRFEKWFLANGGKLHGVHVTSYESMGRGLEAAESIASEQLILSVPAKMVISLPTMQASPNPDVREIVSAFPSEMALNLWILYEKHTVKSYFRDYLAVLPGHISSLLTFSPSELQELQNKQLAQEALALQEDVHEEFRLFAAHRANASASALPMALETVTFAEYVWAATLINSRGLRFHGQVYLAPMADLFNYEPHPMQRAANSGEFFLKHHVLTTGDALTASQGNGMITVYADRSQSAGLQLFEDYGDNSNDIYLKYHGFVPARNPFACVSVGGEDALQALLAHANAQNKADLPQVMPRKLLDALHIKQIYPICWDDRRVVSKHMQVLLFALSMTAEEAAACVRVINKLKGNWGKVFQQCGYAAAESYVTDKMANKIQEIEIDDEYADTSPATGMKVLGERAYRLLQEVLLTTVRLQAVTTIHEDIEALATVQSHLLAAIQPAQYRSLQHNELAIKYRLANKRQYLVHCKALGVDCGFLLQRTANAPSALPVATAGQSLAVPRSLDMLVADFNRWFMSNGPNPCLLTARPMSGYRIGTLATTTISKHETYLGVPSAVILDAEKGFERSSPVYGLLVKLQELFHSRDDFHELLFVLCHEMLVLKEKSFYWPYLVLLPTAQEQDVPIVWSEQQLSYLSVSTLATAAIDYQAEVRRKYEFIRNISIVHEFFGDQLTFETYRWATAILDSRSIWWNGKRHLVPMLDFINCQEATDVNAVHSTALDEHGFAVTQAGDDYHQGDQVFENYGQPNHIYFLYHGFVLESNTHDCVNVRFPVTMEEVRLLEEQGLGKFLQHLGISAEHPSYTACLRNPLPPQVWAFLAFKTQSHQAALQARTLGKPFAAGGQYLVRYLAEVIQQYTTALLAVK